MNESEDQVTNSSTSREIINQIIGTEDWGNQTQDLAQYKIRQLCSELSVSEGTDQVAIAIYNRSLKQKLIEWRSMQQLIPAVVLAACRTQNLPFSSKDIVDCIDITEKDLNNTFAELTKQIDLEVGPVDPKSYVDRYVQELGRSEVVAKKAKEIISQCMEEGAHSGRSPSAFAASAIYSSSLLCNEKLTQKEVADVVGVDVKTIRYGYQNQIHTLGYH